MRLLLQISLVANLGLAIWAWWEHSTAYSGAENWLKNELNKGQDQAQHSCDELKDCSSIWKIAYDLSAYPVVFKDSLSLSSTETHASNFSNNHSSSSSIAISSQSGHPISSAAKDSLGSDTTSQNLPPWVADLDRRIKNEEIWGAHIDLDLTNLNHNQVILHRGHTCQLMITNNSGTLHLDASLMRQ